MAEGPNRRVPYGLGVLPATEKKKRKQKKRALAGGCSLLHQGHPTLGPCFPAKFGEANSTRDVVGVIREGSGLLGCWTTESQLDRGRVHSLAVPTMGDRMGFSFFFSSPPM